MVGMDHRVRRFERDDDTIAGTDSAGEKAACAHDLAVDLGEEYWDV